MPVGAPPTHKTSSTTVRVRFCETDLMGVVHHANYLAYMEQGRIDYLHRRGISYEDWIRAGIHLPVVEAHVRFRKAARFDDVLTIETTCAEIKRVTVRFTYRVLRKGEVLCEGETLLACVGPDLALKRLPPAIAQVLASPEKGLTPLLPAEVNSAEPRIPRSTPTE
jgi:acyl-CoA thioester hydrolase